MDYSQIKRKLNPPVDGQDVLRLATATVVNIESDSTVDILLDGATVVDVPVLGSPAMAVGSVVQILKYRGSLLVLGPSGGFSARPVEASGTLTNGTTTSISYVNTLATTGVHGVAFIGPPSGTVQVVGRSAGGNSASGQYGLMDWEVREGLSIGSGTIIRATSDSTASIYQSSSAGGLGPLNVSGLVSGLTPGSLYNACLTYATSNALNASGFNRRYISVRPL